MKPKTPLKEKIVNLIESSSWHGIPSASRADRLSIKIMWTICFLVSFAYCSYTIVLNIMDFLNFDVLVKIEMIEEFETEFPAITFCNLNPIDLSNPRAKRQVDKFLMSELSLQGDYLGLNKDAPFDMALCNRDQRDYVRRIPNFYNFSYSIDRMLISCTYDEKECFPSDFLPSYAPIYGNCFSFNVGKVLATNLTEQSVPVRTSRRPGTINGLQLELFVGAAEYQPCWSSSIGVIVVVHNKSIKPLYAEEGFKIGAGLETDIIMEKSFFLKQGRPYSDCLENVNSPDSFDSNFFKMTIQDFGTYSQKWCISTCANYYVDEQNKKNCVVFNNSTRPTYAECIFSRKNLTNFYKPCLSECPTPCETSKINTHTTVVSYPSLARLRQYLMNGDITRRFPYANVTETQLQKSILSINAYLASATYQKVTETPATSLQVVLANLGGQLGLMLGCSLLSFIEILEIWLEIIFYFFETKFSSQDIRTFQSNK